VTYVSVKPGSGESVPIPDDVRAAFEEAIGSG
jgi:acyl-CoA thioesterase FadM